LIFPNDQGSLRALISGCCRGKIRRGVDLLKELGVHNDDQLALMEKINALNSHTGIEVKLESEYAS